MPPEGVSDEFDRLGTLKSTTVIVVLINVLYITVVVFGNITDFDINQTFIPHALAMDMTNFDGKPGEGLDPDTNWRATESPGLANVAYMGSIAGETLTALVLRWATVARWRVRSGAPVELTRARGPGPSVEPGRRSGGPAVTSSRRSALGSRR